jgi:hypothetical protein
MGEENTNSENLRLVYTEANANRRHYSNLRFAVHGVFFAVLGGVASVAFEIVEIKSPAPARIVWGARIAGLCFTVLFFWFEILGDLNLRHFGTVANHLEDEIGYRQLSNRAFRRYVPRAFYFTWSMYVLLILFWTAAIFWSA